MLEQEPFLILSDESEVPQGGCKRNDVHDCLFPGSVPSAMALAKLNKELIEKNKQALLNPVKPIVKCGLDNPCNFGKHNKNFNKDCFKVV